MRTQGMQQLKSDHQQADTVPSRGHTTRAVQRWSQSASGWSSEDLLDNLAEEQPVALVYNGISHAVMMATPDHLDEFALGFSISEGLIQSPSEIYDIDVTQQCQGWSVNIEISSQRMMELKQRRRNLAGRTGCGLCGTESLEQAIRPLASVDAAPLPSPDTIEQALSEMTAHQSLKKMTGASHAAVWADLTGQPLAIREDVGRHNALDKLIGYLVTEKTDLKQGFLLISSRASYEMVQKTASAGISNLVAISAPTALAVEQASQSGINLIAFARNQRFILYTQNNATF